VREEIYKMVEEWCSGMDKSFCCMCHVYAEYLIDMGYSAFIISDVFVGMFHNMGIGK